MNDESKKHIRWVKDLPRGRCTVVRRSSCPRLRSTMPCPRPVISRIVYPTAFVVVEPMSRRNRSLCACEVRYRLTCLL